MTALTMLAHKEPVVSTFGPDTLRTSATDVLDAYNWHAETYVEQPALRQFRESFARAVREERTPKGCLVAPFGYGKTASAIGLWQAYQREGFLAIPPISYGSFNEIARATADWLSFVCPALNAEVEILYQRFLEDSANGLARRDEEQFNIPFEQAFASITDKLERGYLSFEDLTLHLLRFLEEVTQLAVRSGFPGLIVFVDEFQQLLGNASKGTLVAFRQLIWGLRTRQLPFGLLITMDPETERTLADRAGDILHRIKDDGLHLNLQHVYDRGFPARLWNHYGAVLTLTNGEHNAIDAVTLDALGQMCERDDLSNGPRTVIDALRIAAIRAEMTRGIPPYTPIDLIDDVLAGTLRFDGDHSALSALVAELLEFSYFQRSPELARALKLMAAFPRGCPEEIARAYGLTEAWRRLGEELRGEIVTQLDEGLTLVELQRVGQPANRLNVLLRRYWLQITDAELLSEDSVRSFVIIALPLLFPRKKHDLRGWSGLDNVQLSPEGDYRGIIVGTSSPRFPLRRIALRVTGHVTEMEQTWANDVDLSITFRLAMGPTDEPMINVSPSRDAIEFTLALARGSQDGLRGGLAWLEHYFRPQRVSPALVLSLLGYLAQEEPAVESTRDRARIEDVVARLRAWVLNEMFPTDLFASQGLDVVQPGQEGLNEVLFRTWGSRWPDYRPIAVHMRWGTLIEDYEAALQGVSPSARVGSTSVGGSKSEIATLFRQNRHAGLESRLKQYRNFLRLETWAGDDAAILFQVHPAELFVAQKAREAAGNLTQNDAYHQLREMGYASEEATVIMRVIRRRGLLVERDGILSASSVPTSVELLARAKALRLRAADLQFDDADLLSASRLESLLNEGIDPMEVGWRLDRYEDQLFHLDQDRQTTAKLDANAARNKLLDSISQLHPIDVPDGTPELVRHLRALHGLIDNQRLELQKSADDVLTVRRDATTEIQALIDMIVSWSARADLFGRWCSLSNRLGRLQQALQRLDSDAIVLKEIESGVGALIGRSRSTLSEFGISGLHEVGRLELAVQELEHRFDGAEGHRRDAFQRVAHALASEVWSLGHISIRPAEFSYDPSDDHSSFKRLTESLATVMSRAIATWSLEVATPVEPRGLELRRGKLLADIRVLAQRAGSVSWLFTGHRLQVSGTATKAIVAVRKRVSEWKAKLSSPGRHVSIASILSSLPTGTFDLEILVSRLDDEVSKTELVAELLRLSTNGTIRVVIDLPRDGS